MYNEELSIAPLREVFDGDLHLPAGCDHRIVAVDDGSRDATLKLVNQWAVENSRVKVISHTRNMGVGQAILTGFTEAIRMKSTCAVTLDADDSHPGQLITHLVSAIVDEGADIAIASRFVKGGAMIGVPPLRKLYSYGARMVMSMVFPLRGVRDYTVGFRAYRTALLHEALSKTEDSFLKFSSFATSAEILLKVAPLAGKIVEIPLVLRYDQKRSPSKLRFKATMRDYGKLFLLPKQTGVLGRGLQIANESHGGKQGDVIDGE
jgi:dolichol-phosphate mannosyltransferase